jgi:hypothetical protein
VTDSPQSLASRREVLVARATVQRLQAQLEAGMVREALRPKRMASSLAGTSQARSLLIAAALALVGRTRFAPLVRWASLALAVVQVVRSASRTDQT